MGIINLFEKKSVQEAAERKADDIRYKADHPIESFFDEAIEFVICDFFLGDFNCETVQAADFSGPALEKMYGNEENLRKIVNYAAVGIGTTIQTSDKGRTLINTKINGKMTRVDIEFPQGNKPANLHVQIKGENSKFMINTIDDIEKLPKSVAKNSKIVSAIKKGLKMLGKLS